MNITIDIAPDIESRLLQEAARQGLDPGQYVVNAVRARLEDRDHAAPRLDAEQSRLLEEINQGLSQTVWSRYYALVAKRQAGALTENEFAELTAMSERIEELNARRMEHLAELSRLRGTTLPELLDQLGIVPPPVI
jgi:hypothetical protein